MSVNVLSIGLINRACMHADSDEDWRAVRTRGQGAPKWQ